MLTLNRIKLILLVLFLAINGYFIYQYITSMEAAGSVAPSITIKNVTVVTNNFPEIPVSVPTYLATNKWGAKTDISTAILGDDCYMKEINMYQNAEYNLWVNGGRFEIYPQNATADRSSHTPGQVSATSKATNWLKEHNIWGKEMASLGSSRDEETNDRIVAFSDKLGKYPVLDSYVSVRVGDGGVRHVAGSNWLATEYTLQEGEIALISLQDLLSAFADSHADSPQITVTRIEFGYYVGARAPDYQEVQTIPAVRLLTESGETYIAAETGEEIIVN